MKKKVLVIYHSSDLDGICSRDISKKWARECGHDITSIGWTHNNPDPVIGDEYNIVVIADIMLGIQTMCNLHKQALEGKKEVIWIDHHFTSMELAKEHGLTHFKGIQRIGTAACALCWEYFFDSRVPQAVQLLSAYDVWDKNLADWNTITLPFQYGMRLYDEIPETFLQYDYKSIGKLVYLEDVINIGNSIIAFEKQKHTKNCASSAFEAHIYGYKAICLNTLDFSSNTFSSIWDEDRYDVMFAFAYTGQGVRCSLYTTNDINCGDIAKKFGGGGHKKAAGFLLSVNKLAEFLYTRQLTIPIDEKAEQAIYIVEEYDNGEYPGINGNEIRLIVGNNPTPGSLFTPNKGQDILRVMDTVASGVGRYEVIFRIYTDSMTKYISNVHLCKDQILTFY